MRPLDSTEQIGNAQDIYARPATRFVAEFVGQVNRLTLPVHGEVLVRDDGQAFFVESRTLVAAGARVGVDVDPATFLAPRA